ncbi:MAG: hypothetical protein KDJ73_02755, partial [Notoacmeibacter sp.]|nr:hypothetical protein [Notoacmeibacter sp.]
GTGEASGEGRAMAAAEAAIANPLLDESSMKGAGGLLISITGGRDMTLYEVDEAATRIREEVDPDANIILGATFDEELEGVIRVSVVATGIENSGQAHKAAPMEIRAAARPAAPAAAAHAAPAAAAYAAPAAAAVVRPAAQPGAPVAAAPAAPLAPVAAAPAAAQPRPAMDPVAAAIRQAEAEFQPAPAPVQRPAVSEDDFRPMSRLFQGEPAAPAQPQAAAPRPAAPVQQPIAAALAQPQMPAAAVQPRMPRVEDFPPVVKAEMEARSAQPEDHEDRGPMGLLKRLTNGLSRRDEETASLKPAHPDQAPREPQLRQPQPEARRAAPQDASVYAPRRGQLDDQGRLRPAQAAGHEDDQLEIPAFLRRQAN